ncbi:hypothetical protein [Paenibacillus sacheonensis]|uniref:DUF4367 domain-containing protein n=1 Tax=Paenibacillus sacheonensis TaxID=742054 RepID=A0A7X4YLI7_9BACL|nr:hypothetical protein [Paenibacillus sacheonensis]MBM7568241.1 hypothetical protein [Paenibacillus sacheonensis]NBC68572.1 hypothetical protein [Paenibacillus sacheonensis]
MSTKDPKHLSADQSSADYDVTDEQIEEALNRLFRTVKDEDVPAAWAQRRIQAKERAMSAPFVQPALEEEPGNPALEEIKPAGVASLKVVDAFQADAEASANTSVFASSNAGSMPSLAHASPSTSPAAAPGFARKQRRRARRWTSGVVAAALAGVMLFTSWGQDVMANMLNTFRVQHFEAISLTEADFNGFRQALEDGTVGTRQLDLRLYGEIQQSGSGSSRTVGAAEAEQLADRQLKLLPGTDVEAIEYMPQQEITFKLHPKEINKLIAMLGGKTELPASIDNAPIKLTVPNSFTMVVHAKDSGASNKRLLQLPAPALDVSEDVDVEQVRQAILDLPILPDTLRAKLAAIGDWRSTLPVPSMSDESSRTLRIAGNDAILNASAHDRTLIWLQGDWMYVLSGSLADYPTENDMIKEAEGLMKS